MTLNLANWNVDLHKSKSENARSEIRKRIEFHAPEIICLTEGRFGLLPQEGDTIHSQLDEHTIRKSMEDEWRKVFLWSRNPWKSMDDLGDKSLRCGRFVSGVTETSLGEVTVVGICIPWHESPRRGSGVPHWKHHRQYSEILRGVLKEAHEKVFGKRLIIMGDFNHYLEPQRRPSSSKRAQARSALEKAIPEDMTIVTKDLKFEGKRGVDHIVLSEDLVAECRDTISNIHSSPKELSDHFGVVVRASTK